jgi:hypothetical protein
MCDALGLKARGQSQRIDRHSILSRGKGVCILHTPGGEQSVVVLRADLVPLWLAGVRTNMVSEEVRPKLERFQEEAAAVLWEAFQQGRLASDPTFSGLLEQDTPAVQAYKAIQAVLTLAQAQILTEARISDHERRLEDIEAQLGDTGRYITEEQASMISQAVKAVATVYGKKSGRNEFGAVYGELYRKFGVAEYRHLPARRFREVMDWLTEWYASLTDDDVPF